MLNCQSNGSCTYTSVRRLDSSSAHLYLTHLCIQYDAEDPCFVADTSIPCKCPLDRIGSRCESGRPFACNFDLVSPQPECQQLPYPDSLLDGDPPCFTRYVSCLRYLRCRASVSVVNSGNRWTRNEAILWTYNVRCAFLDTAGIDVQTDLAVYSLIAPFRVTLRTHSSSTLFASATRYASCCVFLLHQC